MSAKSGEAHGDWQFLGPVRDMRSKEDKDSLDHSSKVRGNPLGVTHQLRDSQEQAQCVPLHKLRFSSLGACDWHSNESSHLGPRCLVGGPAKAGARMRL